MRLTLTQSTSVRPVFFLVLIAALCCVPHAAAQSLTTNGYVTPYAVNEVVVGTAVNLQASSAVCYVPQSGPALSNAVVTVYSSSTPNTAGTAIGSYNMTETGYVFTPTVAGSYYISMYLAVNGVTSCQGTEDSSPVTVELLVINP
jgi:hypothetical protein